MRRTLAVAALPALTLAGCATVATATIESRLVDLGLSERRAACMGDELNARLDDDELTKLARHMVTLSRADSAGQVVDAVAGIDDVSVAAAVVASGAACLFSAR